MNEIILALTIIVGGSQVAHVSHTYPNSALCQQALQEIDQMWQASDGHIDNSVVIEAQCHNGDYVVAETATAFAVPYRRCRSLRVGIGATCEEKRYATYGACVKTLNNRRASKHVACLSATNPTIRDDDR